MDAYAYKLQEINIEHYLPLVKKIVYQLNIKETSVLDKDDLLSVGVLGLLDAMKKYNSQKNASFETYAKLRIRGSIIDEFRRVGVISREKNYKIKEYYRYKETLIKQLQAEPTDEQLCESMKITPEELKKIYLNIHYLGASSLDEIVSKDEKTTTLLEVLESPEESVLTKLERLDTSTELVKALNRLTERERYVLNFYYVEELSLAQIANILDISVSRVSQIHGKSLSKVKGYLKESEAINDV